VKLMATDLEGSCGLQLIKVTFAVLDEEPKRATYADCQDPFILPYPAEKAAQE